MTCRHIFDEYGLCFECDQRRNEMTHKQISAWLGTLSGSQLDDLYRVLQAAASGNADRESFYAQLLVENLDDHIAALSDDDYRRIARAESGFAQ